MAKLHGLPFLWVIHLFICLFIYSFTQRDPHKPKICLRCIIVQKKEHWSVWKWVWVLEVLCWSCVSCTDVHWASSLLETFSKPQIKLISHTLKYPYKLVQSDFNTAKFLCLEGLLHADALVVNDESHVTLLLLNPPKAFSHLWLLSNPTIYQAFLKTCNITF